MGSYKIVIEGTGFHHNGDPAVDANLLALEFVRELNRRGQSISRAIFVQTGPEESIMP